MTLWDGAPTEVGDRTLGSPGLPERPQRCEVLATNLLPEAGVRTALNRCCREHLAQGGMQQAIDEL